MKLTRQSSVVVVAAAAISLTTWVQGQGIDYGKIEILTEKIAPNLYMLAGSAGADPGHQDAAGGRIGVLAGPDGIFMVDAQYAQITDKVVAAIKKISPEPIRFLVNTHVHPDHTAGNANFVKMGALLFAREELREEMLRPPARPGAGNAAPAGDPARLPVVTYGMGDPVKLRLNGEIVDLIPVRAAHTGGDTMIRFENADVIMIGDFYRNYGYPFIDTNNGGTLKGGRHHEACGSEHEADPRARHCHQSSGHRSLPGYDPRRTGQGAADDQPGQERAGSPGRESDGALRREGSRGTVACWHRDQRRPVCQYGVCAAEGRQVSSRALK
jgi:glyoxylase-like metal-dependent hydrolase (beta-lactamase superfamily II)